MNCDITQKAILTLFANLMVQAFMVFVLPNLISNRSCAPSLLWRTDMSKWMHYDSVRTSNGSVIGIPLGGFWDTYEILQR